MKKKLSVLLFPVLLSQFAWSQYRITIDTSDTYKYGMSYLIDIPFNGDIRKLYLDNRNGIIPAEVLFSTKNRIWYNLDTLIVLEKVSPGNDASKPNDEKKDKFEEYIIPRYGNTEISKGINTGFLKYKSLSQNTRYDQDSVLIYYSEEYGSECCPRDPIYDMKPSLNDFIKQFENTHQLKIGKSYCRTMGEEGERIIYFTLSGLTPMQKIDFMDTRLYQLMVHRDLKKIAHVPIIFMPFLVSKNNLNICN